MTLRADPA